MHLISMFHCKIWNSPKGLLRNIYSIRAIRGNDPSINEFARLLEVVNLYSSIEEKEGKVPKQHKTFLNLSNPLGDEVYEVLNLNKLEAEVNFSVTLNKLSPYIYDRFA